MYLISESMQGAGMRDRAFHSKHVDLRIRRYTYGAVPFLAVRNITIQYSMMIFYTTTLFSLLSFFLRTSSAFPGSNFLLPRTVCYEDDVLQSFQTWEADSVPYCSSLLGISDHTTFVGPTKSYTYAVFDLKSVHHLRVAELPSQLLRQLAMIH